MKLYKKWMNLEIKKVIKKMKKEQKKEVKGIKRFWRDFARTGDCLDLECSDCPFEFTLRCSEKKGTLIQKLNEEV